MTMRLTADQDLTAALARMLAATARPGQTILLDGPVARWRVITLDAVGEDAEATDWMSPAPAAR